MNLPGFTAEASLGPATGMYIGEPVHFWSSSGFTGSISPQQLSTLGTSSRRDCFGSRAQCVADHCIDIDVSPRQRAYASELAAN